MSAYISIGRNVNGTPMRPDAWEAFIAHTKHAVDTHAGPVLSTTEGVGLYGGTSEATAIIVGAGDHERGRLKLRAALSEIARRFKQECIALSFVEPEFVR